MVESHRARGIDEDIAAELSWVPAGVSRQPAVRELFGVGQPGSGSQDVPQLSPMHPVVAVKPTVTIDENGPCRLRFRDVCADERRCLERHYYDPHPQRLERRFVLLQLQQVPAAGKSTEVPMEDEQEPLILVIGEAVNAPLRIRQLERNRRPANLTSSHVLCHARASSMQRVLRLSVAIVRDFGGVGDRDAKSSRGVATVYGSGATDRALRTPVIRSARTTKRFGAGPM